MRWIILFILVGVFNSTTAQKKLSKNSLVKDLRFLQEAAIYGHGMNYQLSKTDSINIVFDQIIQEIPDSISAFDYDFQIRRALKHIGCIHSSIKKSTLPIMGKKYFPGTTLLLGDKLYLLPNENHEYFTPQHIKSINGFPSSYIVDKALTYRTGDGHSNAFCREYFNKNSSFLVSYALSFSEKYVVQTDSAILSLDGTDTREDTVIYKRERILDKSTYITQKKFTLLHDTIGYYKIDRFTSDYEKINKQVLKIATRRQVPHLIIDLRGNVGGSRKVGIDLARYLIYQPFSYSIYRANHIKPKKYYSQKGRRYFRLSKLKYDTFSFFRAKSDSTGKHFNYKYNAHNEVYGGKIYFLIDGYTASTSSMALSLIRQNRNIVVIGRQTGGGDNGNNGGSFPLIKLPKSGIEIVFPPYRIITDEKSFNESGIIPDFEIKYEIEDIMEERDKDLEFTVDLILNLYNIES